MNIRKNMWEIIWNEYDKWLDLCESQAKKCPQSSVPGWDERKAKIEALVEKHVGR